MEPPPHTNACAPCPHPYPVYPKPNLCPTPQPAPLTLSLPSAGRGERDALSKVLLLWSPSLLKAPHLQPELSDKTATYSFIYSTSLALLVQAFCTQVSPSSMALDEEVQVGPALDQTLTSHHSWTSGPSGCQRASRTLEPQGGGSPCGLCGLRLGVPGPQGHTGLGVGCEELPGPAVCGQWESL